MQRYTPLEHHWTVRPLTGDLAAVPATVPGCVTTDLLTAGAVPDPLAGDNEDELAWIGQTAWVYETGVSAPPGEHDRVDLVCEGLDTVARIEMGGVEVASTENMHRGYRFDVSHLLGSQAIPLSITFGSALEYIEHHRERLGDLPTTYPDRFNFIRKMACNFGWDWGPRVITAGIWQSIGLHAWSTARLDAVRPQVTVDAAGDGRVAVRVDLERTVAIPVVVTVAIAGARASVEIPATEASAVVVVTVPTPELWWPRGYGHATLYPLAVELATVEGESLDSWERTVGFRTVTWDTTPDELGSPYTLVVNGTPIFVRGVNWIPDDPFPSRITRHQIAERFSQAIDANVNYLRVWGGGRYESHDFYDLADRLGLLVGQDFLFACAAYPEEEPFFSEVEAEARYQITRLMPHPSLVNWTGNNECIWGRKEWGWETITAGRTWGLGYYEDLLPRLVAEIDPSRPYWPGSPYSGSSEIFANEQDHGSMHIWDVWNTENYTKYRDYQPRFVAEFGFQGPPAYSTLRRALGEHPFDLDSPTMARRQKADDGYAKLARGLADHMPMPVNFDDWHYLSQVNQARALRLGIEHFRSLRGRCMGTIMWQLNDCWAVNSWSVIDGDGHRKPLWYALREAYADVLVTVQPSATGLRVVIVNDSRRTWTGRLQISRRTLHGDLLASHTADAVVSSDSTQTFDLPTRVATADDVSSEVIVVDGGPQRAWWFFAEDKDLALTAARLDTSVEPTAGGYMVHVRTRDLVRDLSLFPDRLDPHAQVDQALVTLLPQEEVTFAVTTDQVLPAERLVSAPVLRSVNDVAAENGRGGDPRRLTTSG